MKFLILTRRHVGDFLLWWGPNRCGYTANVDEAGRYDESEGSHLIRRDDGEVLVEESVALAKTWRAVHSDEQQRLRDANPRKESP